jgi:hypothetical protein
VFCTKSGYEPTQAPVGSDLHKTKPPGMKTDVDLSQEFVYAVTRIAKC